jgi:hypothetical protein
MLRADLSASGAAMGYMVCLERAERPGGAHLRALHPTVEGQNASGPTFSRKKTHIEWLSWVWELLQWRTDGCFHSAWPSTDQAIKLTCLTGLFHRATIVSVMLHMTARKMEKKEDLKSKMCDQAFISVMLLQRAVQNKRRLQRRDLVLAYIHACMHVCIHIILMVQMEELCDPGCGHHVPSFIESRKYIHKLMKSVCGGVNACVSA